MTTKRFEHEASLHGELAERIYRKLFRVHCALYTTEDTTTKARSMLEGQANAYSTCFLMAIGYCDSDGEPFFEAYTPLEDELTSSVEETYESLGLQR